MIHRITPKLPANSAADTIRLMIALAMFVFVGQASAQSVSLKHIPSGGGTEGVVSGQGTEIVVEVSQTGLTQSVNAIQITFDFDLSLVTLAAPAGWLQSGADTVTLLSITPAPVPASVLFTFTTKVDVTGREFSISLKAVQLDNLQIPLSAEISFNTFRPPSPLDPQLHLDTQIESPAQNNSVLTFTANRPGDTLQIQLFVPDAAGQDIQAFALELALQGKTFDRFIGNISGTDWMGGSLFSGLSASDNPTLSGLFLNAASVPVIGYLGQIDLKVTGVLTDEDKLRVTRASLAMAGGTLQSLDVSNAELSFVPVSLCLGDFDDNGMVNMADFVLFGDVFGTRSSDAGYNALMDMDGSGVIDVADFVLFVNVFGTTCEQRNGGGPTVSIPDANLRAVIEDSLGKARSAPITPSEMASLTRLEAPNLNIGDLTGLEHATNLTDLNLGGNSITDISPLKALTNLSVLSLRDNNISDISVLSDLTNLERLTLATNNLSDISSLQALTNLRILLLRDNKISDISPLVANTGLNRGDGVDVRGNPLSATSLNTHIPALQQREVNVQFDALQSVTIPDANLRAVIADSLGKASGAPITQAEMASLTRLEAPNKEIRDLTGLEFATNLTLLNLGHELIEGEGWVNSNEISDLSPLSGLTSLTELYLDGNNISNVSVLSGLTNLTWLNLGWNSISDISVLSGLTNLTVLDLSATRISDVSVLSNLTNLTSLILQNTRISDVSVLSGLTNLTVLNLYNTRISDVSVLSNLTNLTSLDLGWTGISDVSVLSNLTNLTWLSLQLNSISDVSALSGLTNLRGLWLRNNSISDISPLVANTGLGSGDRVDVRSNPLSATSLNTHIPALQGRGVEVLFDPPPSISSGVKLTQNSSLDNSPAWSPDGRKIVFISSRDHQNSAYANREIYVMNADGSNPVRLTSNSIEDNRPTWSPDGSKIVFSSTRDNSGGEIYVMNADGSNPVRLTHNSVQAYAPVYSPDGSKIAFTSNTRSGGGGEIYVMNTDGSNPRNLTQNGNDYFDAYPAWSPDGTKIAFYSSPDHVRDRSNGIYVVNADGSNLIMLRGTGQVYDLTYSPDGGKIAFVTNANIYVMDADGSNLFQLTDSGDISNTGGINWSSDGGKLIFVSNRDGDDDIYVAEFVTSP